MKIIAKRRVLKLTASALIVCVLLCAWAPSAHARNICGRALSKCLIDSVIALILAGPHTAAIFASGCLNGYIWCLTYYVN